MSGRGDGASRPGVVAVVGGGITGLAAAWAVRRAGWPVVLFEAGDRVGGVIATARTDDYQLELGPASLRPTAALARLLDETGLAAARLTPLPAARRRYVVARGRLEAVPGGPAAALATPLLSLRGKLRLLAEPLVPAAADDAEESVAALVRRRFGAEVLDALVDPFVSGVYAGDPDRLSARHTLTALHRLEHRHGSVLAGAVRSALGRRRGGAPAERLPAMLSFARGLRQLPDGVAAALGSAVRLHTPVVGLRGDDGGWTVETARDGWRATHRVGAVVLATPAHALGALDTDAALGASLARIARVAHAPVATVALGFRRADVAHPLDGFGALVPSREGMDVLGVMFASSAFGGRAPGDHVLLTCFVGGARRPELAGAPAETLERVALDAVRSLLGARGRPTLVRSTQWGPGIPQYEVGHDAVLDAAARAEAAAPGVVLAGSWRGGVSIGDCVACGTAAGERAVAGMVARRVYRPAVPDCTMG